MLAGADAKRSREMGFGQADATDQDHVGASIDELQTEQMLPKSDRLLGLHYAGIAEANCETRIFGGGCVWTKKLEGGQPEEQRLRCLLPCAETA